MPDTNRRVELVDATEAEAEEMLGRTRARGLAALVAAGTFEGYARAMIRQQHAALLPEGVATPGHRFVWLSSPAGERLGECWFGPLFRSDTDWYVYDVVLAEEHRGRGLGREAMEAVAAACRRAGAGRLGLTVERHNTPAIAAYRAAGFATTREDATSADMWRTLAPPPPPERGS